MLDFYALGLVDRQPEAAFLAGIIHDIPEARWDVPRSAAQDDLVFVHARMTAAPGARAYAMADIFRVEDCRIVEHWGVVAGPVEDAPNPHPGSEGHRPSRWVVDPPGVAGARSVGAERCIMRGGAMSVSATRRSPPARSRTISFVLMVSVMGLATSAVASFLVPQSFDRQVVAGDVFVVGVAVGDKAPCDDPRNGNCTTVRVLRALKGETPENISLASGMFPEGYPNCCEAGHVYAMALIGTDGVYQSTNGHYAVRDLGPAWRDAGPGPVEVEPLGRAQSFDQQVVASDAFAVVLSSGERHPCSRSFGSEECTSLTLVRAMKGELPQVIEAPLSYRTIFVRTGESGDVSYPYDRPGQMFALGLYGEGETSHPMSPETVHYLPAT